MSTQRLIPALEALMKGLEEEDLILLQYALDRFDGTYRSLMDHLKSLGAPPNTTLYKRVNGAIAQEMGKYRADVDILDLEEMTLWADGYDLSRERIDNLNTAPEVAAQAFRDVKEQDRL